VPVELVLFNAVAQAKRQKRHAASHHGEAMIVTPGSVTKIAKAQIPNSRQNALLWEEVFPRKEGGGHL